MKNGIDISHWQTKKDWSKIKTDFIICKCTEGLTYLDPTYYENKGHCRNKGIQFGAYHFARGNDAKKEANWFFKNLGTMPPKAIVALDYEIQLTDPATWCLTFLKEIEKLTGVKPYIYINSSTAKSFNWDKVIAGDYPLWIANYGINNGKQNNPPAIGRWADWKIWQYTSRGTVTGIEGNVDKNVMQEDEIPEVVPEPPKPVETPPEPILEPTEHSTPTEPTTEQKVAFFELIFQKLINFISKLWNK